MDRGIHVAGNQTTCCMNTPATRRNYALGNILRGARQREADAKKGSGPLE